MRLSISTGLLIAALAVPAWGQNATTIQVAESPQFGKYLATAEGRPVYMFTTDTQGAGGQVAKVSCTTEDCLKAWPLVTTTGDPQAGTDANAQMLGTTQYEGQTVVTYNGWPLYYFIQDEGASAPMGQDKKSFGGEWYLVSPAGEKLEAK